MSLGNLESKEFQRNAREETYGDPSLCIRHHKTFFSWHHVGACYCWHAHLQIYPWWLQVSRDSQKLCSFHSQISLLPRARRCLKPGMKMLTSGRCTSPCQTKNVHDSPSGFSRKCCWRIMAKRRKQRASVLDEVLPFLGDLWIWMDSEGCTTKLTDVLIEYQLQCCVYLGPRMS